MSPAASAYPHRPIRWNTGSLLQPAGMKRNLATPQQPLTGQLCCAMGRAHCP
ncbi:MAG: hypothetical protein H6669_01615 [Ardenticatenaceae bacterium]|nr:hypothetical protein [Ardenticatenaceae bacterium]